MAAVLVAPHPEPRPALRLVVSSTPRRRVEPTRHPRPLRRVDATTYRRRRALVALAVATLAVGTWFVASAVLAPDAGTATVTTASADGAAAPAALLDPAAPPTAAPAVYVVRPGDTVWSIAERLHPDGDVRELVDQLSERAGGSGLQAGQRIALDGLGL